MIELIVTINCYSLQPTLKMKGRRKIQVEEERSEKL